MDDAGGLKRRREELRRQLRLGGGQGEVQTKKPVRQPEGSQLSLSQLHEYITSFICNDITPRIQEKINKRYLGICLEVFQCLFYES